MAEGFRADPANVGLSPELDSAVGLTHSLPLKVNLAKIQNICYEVLQTEYKNIEKQKAEGGQHSTSGLTDFARWGKSSPCILPRSAARWLRAGHVVNAG